MPWARALAAWLAVRGVRPNAVSLASVAFAAAAGLCLALSLEETGRACWPLLLTAGACIQLRLLCNMVDGLIAVEGGLAGPLGEIYNDLPDRIADAFILVGAGLAVRSMRWGLTLRQEQNDMGDLKPMVRLVYVIRKLTAASAAAASDDHQ